MNFPDFQADALKTESRIAALKVNPSLFLASIVMCFHALNILDQFKKTAFYGKNFDTDKMEEHLAAIYGTMGALQGLKEHVNDPNIGFAENGGTADFGDLRVLHGIVGTATEAGELLKCLVDSLGEPGEPNEGIDAVNVGEEYGDIDWYKAVTFDALGLSEEDTRNAVIAKLKLRYGDKFDASKAINRDTDAERVGLERDIPVAEGAHGF